MEGITISYSQISKTLVGCTVDFKTQMNEPMKIPADFILKVWILKRCIKLAC